MRWFRTSTIVVFMLALFSFCTNKSDATSGVLSGAYWKDQALNDIMPYWTKYAQDTKSGVFFTNLDSLWQPFGNSDKYPSMISRHLFSYSVSYLLSGNKDDLKVAEKTVKWLLDHAWDKEYGGWFDSMDENGNPVETTKTTFVQVYAITGLAMYYFITHDSLVLSYIEKSNSLLESKAWDQSANGYYNVMNRDWSIKDSNKSFSSQVTPVSGYLIYLYCATREAKYLNQIEKIMETTTAYMIDKESGWILEDFDRNWMYLVGKQNKTEVNIGHNIEWAWMLLRIYFLTGKIQYLNSAREITTKIAKWGVLNEKEVWLTTTGRKFPFEHGSDTYWWVQAYGNMFNLYWYHSDGEDKYLDGFQRGAIFWDTYFVDKKHGDNFFSTDTTGIVKDATKANRFKTSYHSMEHCLLNYLCLNLWINKVPVEFHFRINSSRNGELLYPVLLEDKNIKISRVVIKNKDQNPLMIGDQAIRLPELQNTELKVFLINQNSTKRN